jgi:hypothetical protein
MRTPAASSIALAIALAIGRQHCSLAGAFGTERTGAVALLLGNGQELWRQVLGERHTIDERIKIQDFAAIIVDHALEQCLAERHDGGAVFLPLAKPED